MWNQDFKKLHKHFKDFPQLGFIAQEIENYIPEVVLTDLQGYKAIDYSKLISVAVNALQSQQDLIKSQTKRIENQQHRIEALHQKQFDLTTLSDRIVSLF